MRGGGRLGLRLPGRFEWKILGAMLLVAGLSVATATFALRYSLRNFAALAADQQRSSGSASRRAADVFRTYFAERKDDFRARTDAIAARPPATLAELGSVDGLLRARLLEGDRVVEAWEAPPDRRARVREAPPTVAAVARRGSGAELLLELTFGIPLPMYEGFLDLQREIDQDLQRDRAYEAMVPEFIKNYLGLVLALLAIAPLVGFLIARRATARVARLRDAALRVGAGDLSVQVAPRGKDELDELGRAFDGMVRELADARSRLEYLQKVSAWQEVARRLAHEIKNPLTPIQLSVQELVIKYRGDDPAYRRLLDTAAEILQEEIASLRRLVDDFSAFSKLPKVEPQPLDLAALVEELPRLHPEWHEQVTTDVRPGPATALCDKTLLRRALANLVDNALEAAAEAGRAPAVRITVEPRPGQQTVALVVDDNGPGVPPDKRRRIFDPYVTFKASGTGLGLAIVRKIVIDHGGDVSTEQAPPPLGGARFVVEIPAAGREHLLKPRDAPRDASRDAPRHAASAPGDEAPS